MDILLSNPLIIWLYAVILFGVGGVTLITAMGFCDTLSKETSEEETKSSTES